MDRPTRRRLLAGASTSLFAAVAGCLTGDGADTRTTATRTTRRPTTTATTENRTTTTAESTTATTEDRTTTATDESTTATTTTEEPATTTTAEPTSTTAEPTTTTTADPEPAVVVAVGPGGATRFDPEETTVSVGDVVEWRWDSDGHNVVVESQPSGADWSGTGDAGTTFDEGYVYSHRFDVAGTYEYECYPHQNLGMVGTVVVE